MQTQEFVKATGNLNIILKDESTGVIKMNTTVPNLVVTVGKNWIASRMANTAQPPQMSHMAIGSGTNAPAVANTALDAQLGIVTLTTAGGTPSGNTVTYQGTFPAGTGTGSITEAGIFNTGSAGTMLCRTVFGVVTKTANDSISISWAVTLS